MDHRLLTSLQARLRFAAANPQPVPLLAGLLVIAAAGVQLFLLPGMERADEADQAEITRIERNTRRMNIVREETVASPVDTRERVLGHFPRENELNVQLGRLLDLANKEGLQIPTGDYRPGQGQGGRAVRPLRAEPAGEGRLCQGAQLSARGTQGFPPDWPSKTRHYAGTRSATARSRRNCASHCSAAAKAARKPSTP